MQVKFSTKLFFAILVFLFVSCNKQPSADFSMDKTSYSAGEVVKLGNKSLNAEIYKWTMPDGQTSNSKNVNYTIDINTVPGTYSVSLEVFSKKGDKTSVANKNFTIL